jgi:HEAT repeat protein
VPALIALLSDEHEPAKMNAAYALAAIGKPAVAPLVEAMRNEDDIARRYAAYGLGAAGAVAADAAIAAAGDSDEKVRTEAMFALSEIGETDGSVAKALAKGAADAVDHVRLHAVDALGTLGINAHTSIAVDALERRLTDSDVEVRFNAVLGLARLADAAAGTVPALRRCLRDENRYVQGYAVDALHRIGTPEAMAALLPHLKAARWCPMTTNDSPFYP